MKVRLKLGDLVRLVRKSRGVSIEELSARSGVSVVTISKIENGGDSTFTVVRKLENSLGVALLNVEI